MNGRRMLVVDDEEQVTAALGDYFATLGYRVDRAGSAQSGRALLDESRYDAVITDLSLAAGHGLEGLDVVSHLRARDSAAVCVVLTAYGDCTAERQAWIRGADAFLEKPSSLAEIADLIDRILGAHRGGIRT